MAPQPRGAAGPGRSHLAGSRPDTSALPWMLPWMRGTERPKRALARESLARRANACVRRANGSERGTRGGRQGRRFPRKDANPAVRTPGGRSRPPPGGVRAAGFVTRQIQQASPSRPAVGRDSSSPLPHLNAIPLGQDPAGRAPVQRAPGCAGLSTPPSARHAARGTPPSPPSAAAAGARGFPPRRAAACRRSGRPRRERTRRSASPRARPRPCPPA